MKRLPKDFYTRDALLLAPELLGKTLVRQYDDNVITKHLITEVEAYIGEEDKACHANKGRTKRTDIMYKDGGLVYMYLIYGMYWMLNIVSSVENSPQAILIRGIDKYNGPGKLSKALRLDKSFYGEDLMTSNRLWIEDMGISVKFETGPRIGIDYASEEWRMKPWRYIMVN